MQKENIRVPASADNADDIISWVVIDDDLKDNDSEGMMFCTGCIDKYIGDGEIIGHTHEELRGTITCECCERCVSVTKDQ